MIVSTAVNRDIFPVNALLEVKEREKEVVKAPVNAMISVTKDDADLAMNVGLPMVVVAAAVIVGTKIVIRVVEVTAMVAVTVIENTAIVMEAEEGAAVVEAENAMTFAIRETADLETNAGFPTIRVGRTKSREVWNVERRRHGSGSRAPPGDNYLVV